MTITQDSENEARRLLALAAEDPPPSLDLLAGFQARRRQRHRPGARVLLAAGTAVATAGAAVAITLTAGPAQSARAAVTQAAAATAAQSYRISSRVGTARQSPPQLSQPGPVTITGAFDPVRKTGEETTGDGFVIRFVDGYLYAPLPAKFWPQYKKLHPDAPAAGQIWTRLNVPLQPDSGSPDLAFTLLGTTVPSLLQLNPQSLLALIKSASEVRRVGPASGPGWNGTRYSFSARDSRTVAPGDTIDVTVRGTVDVDQQGRVRRLAATETLQDSGLPRSDRPEIVSSITITFSGFGLPVPVVAAPPQNRVYVVPPAGLLPAPHSSS